MSSKILSIVDGDALCYQSSKESLIESINILDEKIQNIFDSTGATHYVIFISNQPYFRHGICPLYKSSRSKYTSDLKWLKTLKKYLIEGYGAQSMDGVESDDLCAYWYGKNINHEDHQMTYPDEIFNKDTVRVLCAVDKDLLQNIPSKGKGHFNYTYKLEDKNNPNSLVKGWWVQTSKEDSYINFWKSMVCGDNVDSIKGIEGLGEAAFNKMLNLCRDGLIPIEDMILSSYKKRYGTSQGIFEYQKNYRLLHLLDCDQDYIREVGKLPEFPTIREVPIKETSKELDNLKF